MSNQPPERIYLYQSELLDEDRNNRPLKVEYLLASTAAKEREELRDCIKHLMDSAAPNQRDNPTMYRAWREAEQLLARNSKGDK